MELQSIAPSMEEVRHLCNSPLSSLSATNYHINMTNSYGKTLLRFVEPSSWSKQTLQEKYEAHIRLMYQLLELLALEREVFSQIDKILDRPNTDGPLDLIDKGGDLRCYYWICKTRKICVWKRPQRVNRDLGLDLGFNLCIPDYKEKSGHKEYIQTQNLMLTNPLEVIDRVGVAARVLNFH